jgi:hypothetical protein
MSQGLEGRVRAMLSSLEADPSLSSGLGSTADKVLDALLRRHRELVRKPQGPLRKLVATTVERILASRDAGGRGGGGGGGRRGGEEEEEEEEEEQRREYWQQRESGVRGGGRGGGAAAAAAAADELWGAPSPVTARSAARGIGGGTWTVARVAGGGGAGSDAVVQRVQATRLLFGDEAARPAKPLASTAPPKLSFDEAVVASGPPPLSAARSGVAEYVPRYDGPDKLPWTVLEISVDDLNNSLFSFISERLTDVVRQRVLGGSLFAKHRAALFYALAARFTYTRLGDVCDENNLVLEDVVPHIYNLIIELAQHQALKTKFSS